jgi:hypothetical protein
VSVDDLRPPALLPLLSPGKHRNPRKGACFMELASLLAGQPWSDHPACTHPLLAAVARHVNDCTTDAGRQRLTRLIPSVIGLTSDDPRVDPRIALRCATMALPVVSAERQCAMAVAILSANRVLAVLDGRPAGEIEQQSVKALAEVPLAARWAEGFAGTHSTTPEAFHRRSAPSIVGGAVVGISQACIPDPDSLLYQLMADTIDDCRVYARAEAEQAHALV